MDFLLISLNTKHALHFLKVYQKPVCPDKYVVHHSSIIHDNINISRNHEKLFNLNNLKNLSCKYFKATTFPYTTATTIRKLDNSKIKLVLKSNL